MSGRIYVHYNVEMQYKPDGSEYKATLEPLSVPADSKYPEHITGKGFDNFMKNVTDIESRYGIVTHLDY